MQFSTRVKYLLLDASLSILTSASYVRIKGARYLLIIHEVLVAMDFFPAGVQDETLEEESQRLAS